MSAYNVVWDTPSKDHNGSVPLGNGDIGLNAWVEEDGDLRFYISKTDSWGDNARLLKVGKVRIELGPGPLSPTRAFTQTLNLADGTLNVRYGKGDGATVLRLWVDANHPVVYVEADAPRRLEATASIELWRTERYTLPSLECSDVMNGGPGTPTVLEPVTILSGQAGRIGWYHRNVKSVGPELTARIQGVAGFDRPDPLLHRTFGAVIAAEGGTRLDELHLHSPSSKEHRFSIYVLTKHPATPGQWLGAVDEAIAATEGVSFGERREAHKRWWREFWDRSWIHVTSGAPAKQRSPIPRNAHPFRIGVDQRGGNRYSGELGRVSLLDAALTDADIRDLARQDRTKVMEGREGLLYSAVPQVPTTIEKLKDRSFVKGLTIEMWVRPRKLPASGARLVDKITPGVDDGLLLDTWPGNSLRLIVGGLMLRKRDVLPADRWSHVAAVIDPAGGRVSLYLNGEPVAEHEVVAGDDAYVVSRAYALQRFVNACAGRGRYPIKFNGSIFTVPYPGKPGDADYRRWGPGYWWQNTRLPYISMCSSGDFDLMRPLFRMYGRDLMPLFRYRTRLYTGHDGVFIPECIYFWGDMFSETYGWTPFEQRADKLQASRWHKWEWVSGPELVFMMLDYYEHTLDAASSGQRLGQAVPGRGPERGTFLRNTVLPAAHEILTFFELHYRTDRSGKLVMHPSQACETWWDCTDPMPELAGLHAVTDRLLSLPEGLTTAEERAFWAALKRKLPDLPTREVEGQRMLAPAARFADKRNCENPELYAVFPFRLVAVGRPNVRLGGIEPGGIELGIRALEHRWDRGNSGWRQDDIFMAYLGLAAQARDNLVGRARNKHTGSRFPAFWGPNYDWIPDQDHGSVLLKALQAMLMQTDGRRIHLLPAWPGDWNVDFKLHAPYRTVVEGSVKDGRLVKLKVSPESRRNDVNLFPSRREPR